MCREITELGTNGYTGKSQNLEEVRIFFDGYSYVKKSIEGRMTQNISDLSHL